MESKNVFRLGGSGASNFKPPMGLSVPERLRVAYQKKKKYIYIYYQYKPKTKLRGLSPQANYTDRATAAVGEVVPTFTGR
jgi:hypothetical protein